MPETGEGARLLDLLLARYPRPGDADRAMGWPTGRASLYKNRGAIPPKEWDAVRGLLEQPDVAALTERPDLLAHLALIPEVLAQLVALRAQAATEPYQLSDSDVITLVRARWGADAATTLEALIAGGARPARKTRRAGR